MIPYYSYLFRCCGLYVKSTLFVCFPSKSPVNVESQLPFICPKTSLMNRAGKNVPSQKDRDWSLGSVRVLVPMVLVFVCL